MRMLWLLPPGFVSEIRSILDIILNHSGSVFSYDADSVRNDRSEYLPGGRVLPQRLKESTKTLQSMKLANPKRKLRLIWSKVAIPHPV
jgi:hypothetical protein